jgi:DNA-binding response OmpR family regulator
MAEILVVEDFPPMASLVTMMLRRGGHTVVREETVAGALRHNRVFQHAVLDIDLPDGNGVRLGEQLLKEQRVTGLVFFTATNEEDTLSRALRLGLVVNKSQGPFRLLDAIQQLEQGQKSSKLDAAGQLFGAW